MRAKGAPRRLFPFLHCSAWPRRRRRPISDWPHVRRMSEHADQPYGYWPLSDGRTAGGNHSNQIVAWPAEFVRGKNAEEE